jgi:transcriptional regulator with XRE-family HTH domain
MTAEECRARRAAAGLTPYQLARLAGLAERTVVLFEAGRSARAGTLIALRRAFRSLETAQPQPA